MVFLGRPQIQGVSNMEETEGQREPLTPHFYKHSHSDHTAQALRKSGGKEEVEWVLKYLSRKYCYSRFNTEYYSKKKLLKNNSLKSMQVLSGVAHVTECSQAKKNLTCFSILSGTLTVTFSTPWKRTLQHLVPHMVLSSFNTLESQPL